MENQLTEQQENIIKEIALADFESGHFTKTLARKIPSL